ncbi:MAG: dTDP-4-dehydrorhamnose reductase [Caulobacteraceae bacterium]
MKALIAGAGGQLGAALLEGAGPGIETVGLARAELDIADEAAVREALLRERPDLVFNAAAYTAVDRAESETAEAFRVNRDGAANLARAAREVGARLIHVSTDFVFDGERPHPWRPQDVPAPVNLYGASKLAGERAVLEEGGDALIVRTAWVYAHRGRNFLLTMLRLMADREEVRVVSDQIGAPTSAASLARGLWGLARVGAKGVLHLTDAGCASWYDFACAIADQALDRGLLERSPSVTPIASADWPTPARRPAFSVLDCSEAWRRLGGPAPHWRSSLSETIAALARERMGALSP